MKSESALNENEWLPRLKEGDAIAFNYIYDKYSGFLIEKLDRLIKIESLVKELHQEAFIRLWKNREQLTEDINLKAYLFTIAKNLIIDFYRKAAKDKELRLHLALHSELVYNHIESGVFFKETSELLEEIISLLPDQRQRVFRMIKIDGKSYQEVADQLGVSLSAIKDHMWKSTKFLKEQLGDKYQHITFALAVIIIFN